ncbi:hypothetical protein [Nonlabens xiamenensis]|uniref:hypothetical protein n=1 Tax=Nonlabens xiamenensis TaxID=2341043 RepID=UPI000F60ACC2|nr:hypothetical protein [Nonlabens xiamenensis]
MIKSKFIQDILTLLLDGDKDGEEVKEQLDFISETELNYTGVGVFISFEHAEGIEDFKTTKSNLVLNGVTIKSPELEIGADSTLFFKNGFIDYLELWSFNGEYPKNELTKYELKQEWAGSPEKKIVRNK